MPDAGNTGIWEVEGSELSVPLDRTACALLRVCLLSCSRVHSTHGGCAVFREGMPWTFR